MKLIVNELLASLLLGGVPAIIIYKSLGSEAMVDSFSHIVPTDWVLWYFFWLTIIAIIARVVDKNTIKATDKMEETTSFISNLLYEVGFTLHGVLRVVAGSVPVVICILLLVEGFTEYALKTSMLGAILSAGCFVACIWLSKLQRELKK